MKDTITIKGKILFDPKDHTTKHKKQSSWKKMAMVMIDGEWCEYYSWFIWKRYNLRLTSPLRDAHISFINDGDWDIKGDWEKVKKKWDGKKITITLSVDPRTDGQHWWLNIPEKHRGELHAIRAELGMGRPHFGLHMTIGYANDDYDFDEYYTKDIKAKRTNEEHSKYIHKLIKKGLIK